MEVRFTNAHNRGSNVFPHWSNRKLLSQSGSVRFEWLINSSGRQDLEDAGREQVDRELVHRNDRRSR